MLELVKLSLYGIKSYTQKTVFNFNLGTTLIKGINGSGKSTIIEAVFYCLFGVFPNSKLNNEDIMQKNIDMDLSLDFKINNIAYRVQRKIIWSGKGKNRTTKASGKLLLSSGETITKKKSIDSRIQKILGFNYKLAKNAIYSSQGKLDSLLYLPPSELKKELSKILLLENYQTSIKVLNRIRNKSKQNSVSLKKEYDRLSKDLDDLELIKKQLIIYQTDHKEIMKQIKEKQKERSKIVAALKDLAKMKTKFDEITVRISELEEEFVDYMNKKETLKSNPLYNTNISYSEDLQASKANNLTKLRKKSIRFNKIQNNLIEFETKIAETDKIIESIKEEMKTYKNDITGLIQELDENYGYSIKYIKIMNEFHKDINEREELILSKQDLLQEKSKIHQKYSELKDQEVNFDRIIKENLNKIDRIFSSVKNFQVKVPDISSEDSSGNIGTFLELVKSRYENIRTDIKKYNSDMNQDLSSKGYLEGQIRDKIKTIDTLTEQESFKCSTCGSDLDRSQIESNTTKFKKEIEDNKKLITNVLKSIESRTEKLGKIEREKESYDKFYLLQEDEDLLNIYNNLIMTKSRLNDLKNTILDLVNKFQIDRFKKAEIQTEEEKYRKIIEKLRNILLIVELIKRKSLNNEDNEKKVKEIRLKKNKLLKREELSSDLDRLEIQKICEETRKTTENTQKELTLITDILTINQILKVREKELHEKKEEIKSLEHEIEKINSQKYDQKDNKLEKEINQLIDESNTLQNRIGNIEGQLKKIKELKEVQNNIKEEFDKVNSLYSSSDIISYLLKLIHPALLTNHMRNIENKTNIILKDIPSQSGIFAVKLKEKKDKIILKVENRNQSRKISSLSGGELTSLAFALRVSISREIANCGFLILDEPTYGLDDERKRNLAEILFSQRHVEQLIVISHDDAFDGFTSNLIEVEQSGGSSRNASYEKGKND